MTEWENGFMWGCISIAIGILLKAFMKGLFGGKK